MKKLLTVQAFNCYSFGPNCLELGSHNLCKYSRARLFSKFENFDFMTSQRFFFQFIQLELSCLQLLRNFLQIVVFYSLTRWFV